MTKIKKLFIYEVLRSIIELTVEKINRILKTRKIERKSVTYWIFWIIFLTASGFKFILLFVASHLLQKELEQPGSTEALCFFLALFIAGISHAVSYLPANIIDYEVSPLRKIFNNLLDFVISTFLIALSNSAMSLFVEESENLDFSISEGVLISFITIAIFASLVYHPSSIALQNISVEYKKSVSEKRV
ncbi:MAG: hypothetical protein Q3965_02870 [Rothia sp. (in: high G+C Gram-positive bacteria)]|nr:hypothetical protein [Rothia sp. (in: high G+C Gram-positive bacteria)]